MVITGFDPSKKAAHEPGIHCKWFDKRAELQGQWFPPKLLSRTAPWTERPGYRAALEKIRAVYGDDPALWIDHNSTLGMFIDDVLDHVGDRVSATVEQPEAADAAD